MKTPIHTPEIIAVCRRSERGLGKDVVDAIRLIEGQGVEGDSHRGSRATHSLQIARDPDSPNLRQVHLIGAELFDELGPQGYELEPGVLGENVTTRGIPLLELPRDTILRIGPEVVLRITGLRNPCKKIEQFRRGLLRRVISREEDGSVARKTGVMSVVERGGMVRPGDPVEVVLPQGPHEELVPV